MIDNVVQAMLFILTIGAIFLVARKNKWGFVLGLLSQPFWFYTSYVNTQWGIFLTTVVVTATWVYGIYNWFFQKK
jgi:nicotinamide riboside transporter PnuC